MTLLALAMGGGVLSTTSRAAPVPTYTYSDNLCSNRVDPLNVVWTNVDYLVLPSALGTLFPRWISPLAGSTQFAKINGASCQAQHYSMGREFGPPSHDHSKTHREKIHLRIFETGNQQSAGDAHRERKVRCDNNQGTTDTFSHDVVYKRFNGISGFDAAMNQVATAYGEQSGVSVSVVRSRSPFVSTFRQCNGTLVPWSGDVAYIFVTP